MTIQDNKILIAVKLKDCLRANAFLGRVPQFKEVMEEILGKCFSEIPPKTWKNYLRVWEVEKKNFLNEIRDEFLTTQAELVDADNFGECPSYFVHRVEHLQCDSIGADSMRYLSMGHGFNATNTGKQPITEEHQAYIKSMGQAAKAHRQGMRYVHGKVLNVFLPFKPQVKIRKAS